MISVDNYEVKTRVYELNFFTCRHDTMESMRTGDAFFTGLESFNHPPRVVGRGGTKKAPVCSCLELDKDI